MWDSRLHTEVPCLACLREAPPCGTKAGHAGVSDVPVMENYYTFVQNCPLLSKFFINYLFFSI